LSQLFLDQILLGGVVGRQEKAGQEHERVEHHDSTPLVTWLVRTESTYRNGPKFQGPNRREGSEPGCQAPCPSGRGEKSDSQAGSQTPSVQFHCPAARLFGHAAFGSRTPRALPLEIAVHALIIPWANRTG